jgi:hypothetical protein
VERFSQAPRRAIGVVGVTGGEGVIGFDVNGPGIEGGARVRPMVLRFPIFACAGAEKALPMSLSVSERTCMRIEGAM